MSDGGDYVSYEQPLNERVRTFLRLEFLFAQHRHHRVDRGTSGARATLHCLLDILTVVSRSDLKTEIIKELGDQYGQISRMGQKAGVDPRRLQHILTELESALNAMQSLTMQFVGSALRENEFLLSVLNRSSIPGGTCGFDMPGYHFWLSQPFDTIKRDLDAWFADLAPFDQAISLYLRLMRSSTEPTDEIATGGTFVYTPKGHFQLVRMLVSPSLGVYPEISAGKHRFSIIFKAQRDINVRSVPSTADIPFRMHCCAI